MFLFRLLRPTLNVICHSEVRFTFSPRFSSYANMKNSWGNEVISSPNQDILLQNIRNAVETSDVLYTIKKHNMIMNSHHILQTFQSILNLQKSDNSSMSNGEVIQKPEFQTLCRNLSSHVRSIELSETIDVLKSLSYLGVPSRAKLVQILIHLITKQVNELSLHQIIFLDFLLKDFSYSPLVKALKMALPIIFEAHLRIKIDNDNVSELSELLYYASRRKLSLSSIDFLIDIIMNRKEEINFKSAKSIVRSICNLQMADKLYCPLLHRALDVILDNISNCTFNDFDTILSKLASKFSYKNFYFYHEEFVNSACKFIVDNKCGFEECVWILRKATKLGHVNFQLLEYLVNKTEVEYEVLESCGTVILFSFVGGLAQADFRPNNWNILELRILKNAQRHLDQIELPWIKFLRDLSSLDSWPINIYEKIFTQSFLEKYLSREYNKLDYLQLLALNQAVVSLCPWYSGPKIPKHFLDKAIEINGTNIYDYPLKGALSKGFDNEKYILDGVYTKLGHFIDHVIVLRKGGYPVALNVSRKHGEYIFIENLAVPDGCIVILI